MNENDRHSGRLCDWIWGLILLACGFVVAVGVVLPTLVPAKTHYARNACIANLKQIEGAKAEIQGALELVCEHPGVQAKLVT